MKHLIYVVTLLVFLTGCMDDHTDTSNESKLLISAATSLTDALNEIIPLFEEETRSTVDLNIGGSGTLARQIQQGAPADVFLSADTLSMNRLKDQGLIDSDTEMMFAANQLVLIGHRDTDLSINSLDDLTKTEVGQIAIGNPDSVPAGLYAKDSLEHINIWDNPSLKKKFVYARSVRQVLSYVATGNTDIGFVYKTDLQKEDRVIPLLKINEHFHKPIVYPAAMLEDSSQPDLAEQFLSFIKQEHIQQIFKKHGFSF
ncbi:molybdate transport system substrate-binding protein [Oceanobacillus limi]|uniref:Molybdate transport system substrate-binding protein n=1 Tax=Oceanobacillus limi TaxID=930131 RepID=A0A1I0CYS8_9BACI|nr:molybdate ABC transporter substrate-binding protein [Oceanobacillus limi]SET24950.1 molybdate transport system substrate-binding protein [Oceanobacillus limi]